MRDRIGTIGPIAAVAGALGLCCGLPVLLSLGVLGAVAGLSLQSWALIGLGLVLAVVGWARWANNRRGPNPTCDLGSPGEHQDATPHEASDDTAKGIHR